MAPAWGAKGILPFFLPPDIGPGQVFSDGLPFVENDVYGALFVERFGEAVFDGFIFLCRQLGLERAEQLVPDDEEHAHIPIEIFYIRRMVDPVMAGGHQDVFQPAHFVDELGVDKDAPDLRSGIHKDDIHGPETQKCERNKIDKTVKRLKDRGPETHREIEMLGRMMGDMYRPEKADLVVPAVQPVIEEVLRQQQQQPVGKDVGDRQPVMPVAGREDQQIDAAEQQIDAAVEQHQVNIGKRIFPGIGLAGMLMAIIAEQDFQPDNDEV